jgi:putative ABC transport system ATP-binding protein
MIGFENIQLRIHGDTLLDGAGLRVSSDDKVVVRGPSGCGKSSLLKCAVGVLPISEGSIHIDGLILGAETVGAIRARIAFIGQEPMLGADRVREAILLPFTYRAHHGNRPTEEEILRLLERLHLSPDILGKSCKRISGGEKQRIAIVRALLLGKTIFLADEATSALDPDSKRAVMAELFQPGTTLLSVSHDPDWIETCSRVVEIDGHRIKEVRNER